MYAAKLAFVAASALFISALGVNLHGRDINEPLLESYDYIVVGCGISGLVVTNRLSEDPSRTILCIEAGDPDHYEPIIQDPVYVGADIGGIYDWDLATVPQTQLDGTTRPMPQGKVLGGGSILNAMCWNRGGADDYDAWEALGNPGWNWAGILPYFMKSETYTPVYSQEIGQEYSINYNPAVHGISGPVQVSYPKYFYPQSVNLFAGMNYLGIPTQFDPNDGTSAGPAFVPTDLDPNNQTRSDARRTYFDPYVSRINFHVITGQHVTRVLIEGVANNSQVSNPNSGGNGNGNGPSSGNNNGFGFGPGGSTPPIQGQTAPGIARRQNPDSSNLRITGVEFATNASAIRRTVYATREVIVAAGALHSAQLLQLSGIGPSQLLSQYDIPLALDLPGVGNNLQDHCLVGTFYPYNNASYPSPTELTTNATYNAAAEQEYNLHKTGPWTAGSPNALAFNPLPLISNNSNAILVNTSAQSPTEFLVAGLDPTVIAGYTAQKQSLVQRLAQNHVAAYEIINNNAGSLTVSVMHPFSRGTCHITSADPFQPPAIDPRWLTNPTDRQVLLEALRFNRQILATPPMLELQAAQFVPPVDADENALNQVINTGIRTEFHPSGTLAMLPLEQGGVVDSHLRVWGTQNLRVVDAGIFPLIPAAHLQAVVYAVAEKAADIIKADNLPSSIVPTSSSAASPAVSSLRLGASLSASSSGNYTPSIDSAPTSSRVPLANVTSSAINILQNFTSLPRSAQSSSTSQQVISAAAATRTMGASSSGAGSDSSSGIPSSADGSSIASIPDFTASLISPSKSTVAQLSAAEFSSNTAGAVTDHTSSSPAQSVIMFTTTLPSTLPAYLSSLDITKQTTPATSGSAMTSLAPNHVPSGAAELSSSIASVLASVGIPPSAISNLAPIIIGSPVETSAGAKATSTDAEMQEQQHRAAIEAVIQWLFSFFDLE